MTRRDDGSYDLRVEEDRSLLPIAAVLNEALATQDKRVQGSAEKWLGAVTAIYGLFSLTGIATAKDALAGLNAGSKAVIAVALLIGLSAASYALVQGYRAAYGWPRAVSVENNEQLRAWYKESQDYAPTAVERLHRAIVFALVSLGGVVIVMLLVWFLPRQGGDASSPE